MKRVGKIPLIAFASVCMLLVAAISLTIGWRPFIGPKARAASGQQFERTPQRLARGRYLTRGLAGCETCHSPKDWKSHGAPTLPAMELAGQVLLMPELPGRIVASNLTPDPETGSGRWSDDQLARAIREGIGHDGRPIFPIMPYSEYRNISDEDVASIVVYLRSLPAVRNPLPRSETSFPVNYLIRSAPQPVTQPVHGPEASDNFKRAAYLVSIGCGCHSPAARNGPLPGMAFAGGEHLKGPWGEVTSANITPDGSGIGYYDEATFLKVMRTGYVGARQLNSIMPFGEFQNVSDQDLKAIFALLRTVKPVKHRVDNTLPPTYCKLCRQKHGAGDQN
jgi:hypothetical protein